MTAESIPSENPQQDTDTLRRRLSRLAHAVNRPSRLTLLSYALCAPLLFLLGLFFLLPLLYVLHTGLQNPVIGSAWPEFVQALRDDPDEVPGSPCFTRWYGKFNASRKAKTTS